MALHSVIAKMLAGARAAGRPAFSDGTPQQAREQLVAMRAALGRGPAEVLVETLQVSTRSGSMAALLYRPAPPVQGLVLYLHGGGWVCGRPDDFDVLSRTLAVASGCALLVPDYRLAPEHPFPAGFDDACDALAWADAQMPALLGARMPLVVAGDSAGANLGLAAVLAARRQISVALQAFFYPVTDCDFDTASYRTLGEGMPLTRDDMRWFFGHYAQPATWADPRIAVLRSPDLAASPPTWIATAEYDVLRDEGEAYAQRLQAMGVCVQLHRIAGLPHGFARLVNLVDTARNAVLLAAAAMRAATLTDLIDLTDASFDASAKATGAPTA